MLGYQYLYYNGVNIHTRVLKNLQQLPLEYLLQFIKDHVLTDSNPFSPYDAPVQESHREHSNEDYDGAPEHLETAHVSQGQPDVHNGCSNLRRNRKNWSFGSRMIYRLVLLPKLEMK